MRITPVLFRDFTENLLNGPQKDEMGNLSAAVHRKHRQTEADVPMNDLISRSIK